jgi:hypothetical protein
MKINPCNLYITSFDGYGGIHAYGSLSFDGKRLYLHKKLTKESALKLCRKDFKYKAGMITERFESEDELINLAKKTYKKHFPKADILLLGSSAILDPQLCLDGPVKLKKKINELYYLAMKIGGYEKNCDKMTEISDEYYFKVLGNKH